MAVLGCCLGILFNFSTAAAISLEQALLDDMFVPSSSQCSTPSSPSGSTSTSFDYTFTWSNISSWWKQNAKYEKDTFLAEMGHMDSNVNRTWKVRFGSGGNVYSYINILGEAMPPQITVAGPFVDEVWQTVAVNSAKNVPNLPYFIHQAGDYFRDSMLGNKPFFSPNLAKYCNGNTCSFVSWGQQANAPTPYSSNILYYTRYTDCNNGVLEVTYGIHNFGLESDASAYVDFFDAPWSSVRQSVYDSVLHANPKRSGNGSTLVKPLPAFGSPVFSIKDTGR